MTLPNDLVLVPGLGADAALYAPQKAAFGDSLHAINWIEPTHPGESFVSYARRLAQSLRERPGLRKPYWIGGISFGGMLAAEIAECCTTDVAGLLLIGGCTDSAEVAAPIRWFAGALRYIPIGPSMGLANHSIPAMMSWTQGLGEENSRLYEQVYARGSKRMLKWGAEAMRRWKRPARPHAPVFRAHGRLDYVIPLDERRLRPGVDLVVPDGLHLIHLTHARAVNRWIQRTIAARAHPGGTEWG